MNGEIMHQWAQDLWPICRSLTGSGVRETLAYIKKQIPELEIIEVPSGTPVFDWVVPDEWNVRDAYILNEQNEKVVDFKKNNLHVMGYSVAVNEEMSLETLKSHLYTLPEQPDAIPYVTSYYTKRWGFCLSYHQMQALKPGKYRVVIDSDLKPGLMNYGEVKIPGKLKKEIFLSTYICHPSMANNELSGIVVTTGLLNWIKTQSNRKYSYRVVFLPETIGAIAYLSKNLSEMKTHIEAGFVVTCIGDERTYSYMPSRNGNSLADRVALHSLKYHAPEFVRYSFLQRGSDERQYCSPGVDLPVCSMMRSKYGVYPEYHTSLDDLNLVTPKGLEGGFQLLKKAIQLIEENCFPQTQVMGEPQLGKRGLYPSISAKGSAEHVRNMMNLIAYSDGKHDLIAIAEKINVNAIELIPILQSLIRHDLIKTFETPTKEGCNE